MADVRRESILGLDNIRLDLPIAGIGSRSLAAFLDYLVVMALAFAWVVLVAFLATQLTPAWAPALLIAGWFLLEWGYFAGMEVATGGRTLGKMAVKLRVVTAEGGTPGAGALLARNLVRSLDLIFGLPLMVLDPLSRRLGDRLGGTVVVHDRPPEAAPLLGRVPPGWGPRELALVEAFLARAGGMDDMAATWEMADRILDRLRRDAPELLEGLDTRNDPIGSIRRALQAEG
ncbi:MAG TPA: RDD family protein [Thermoanaerobaculia bacterium]|nr:RDD family protein [Thermoanaerobaculia bacterium]